MFDLSKLFIGISICLFGLAAKMDLGCDEHTESPDNDQLVSSDITSETATENHQDASPRGGKGQRLWKKVKYQLVEYHSLPAYLRDNEYIHGYYRAEWPLKQILLSIFTIHNETLNVWT